MKTDLQAAGLRFSERIRARSFVQESANREYHMASSSRNPLTLTFVVQTSIIMLNFCFVECAGGRYNAVSPLFVAVRLFPLFYVHAQCNHVHRLS